MDPTVEDESDYGWRSFCLLVFSCSLEIFRDFLAFSTFCCCLVDMWHSVKSKWVYDSGVMELSVYEWSEGGGWWF